MAEASRGTYQVDPWFIVSCVLALVLASVLCWFFVVRVRERRRRSQSEHLLFSGALANSIVHDFRNPMSSIKLDSQMLVRESRREGGGDHAKMGALAERIGRTIGRMDDIFREFLFLSRPADSNGGVFDLGRCIDSCIDMCQARMDARHIRCRKFVPLGDIPVYASESAVRRAIVNVLSNAVHYSPEGGVIEVAVGGDGASRTLEIRDKGPGIPAQERERVFEMFRSKRIGGTGLGLFMARSALTNCGGSICIADSNEGCVVQMKLPVQQKTEKE